MISSHNAAHTRITASPTGKLFKDGPADLLVALDARNEGAVGEIVRVAAGEAAEARRPAVLGRVFGCNSGGENKSHHRMSATIDSCTRQCRE